MFFDDVDRVAVGCVEHRGIRNDQDLALLRLHDLDVQEHTGSDLFAFVAHFCAHPDVAGRLANARVDGLNRSRQREAWKYVGARVDFEAHRKCAELARGNVEVDVERVERLKTDDG